MTRGRLSALMARILGAHMAEKAAAMPECDGLCETSLELAAAGDCEGTGWTGCRSCLRLVKGE